MNSEMEMVNVVEMSLERSLIQDVENFHKSIEANKSENSHITNGTITKINALKKLIILSVPSIFGLLSRRIVELLNCGFAGRLEDSNMIAGVGLGIITSNIVAISFGYGISGALDTLCTHAFGNKNNYLAGCYYNRAQVICTLLYIPQAILLFFSDDLLIWVGQSEETSVIAGDYLRVVLPGIWAFCQTELLRRFLGAQGLFNIILKTQTLTTVLHVLWLYLFVFVFDLGVTGISTASCLTYILTFGLSCLYVTYNKSLLKENSWHFINKDSFSGLLEYMRFGGPSLLMLLLEFWCFQILSVMAGILGPNEQGASIIFSNTVKPFVQTPLCLVSSCNLKKSQSLTKFDVNLEYFLFE